MVEKNKKESPNPFKDRVLGDEWLDWKAPENFQYEKIDEKKSVFLLFFSIIVFLITLGILFLFYLVIPRLKQFHPYLPVILGIFIISFSGFILFQLVLFLLSIYREKNFGIKFGGFTFSVNFLFPFAFSIARKAGFSIDRFGNSFIKVHNAITHALFRKDLRSKVLVLIPRCLEKQFVKEIRNLGEKYKVDVVIVGGGSKAREVIKQKEPSAVIGVACERDLVSGIRDVSPKIPVLGVVNERPLGPCKQTRTDVEEVENAIKFFLKQ